MAAWSAKVSRSGRTTLPAEIRDRWGLDGGHVGIIDLGRAALIVPGGMDAARAELHRVLDERYDHGRALIGDPDLADQVEPTSAAVFRPG